MSKKFKIVLIGSSGVGKTSVVMRLIRDKFYVYNDATIGSSFFCLKKMCDNNLIEFQIWDTAGQERYRSLLNMYLRGCNAVIIVYNVSDTNYEEINYWFKYARDYFNNFEEKPNVYLLGNKVDLLDENINMEQIKEKIIEKIKVKMPIEKHEFVSAKTGLNIQEIFLYLTDKLSREIKKDADDKNSTIDISEDNMRINNAYYCCGYL